MPRKSAGSSESPAPRRQSARIAAAAVAKPPAPSPAKKTPKRAAKRVSKSEHAEEEKKVEINGTETVNETAEVVNEGQPAEKKAKIDDQGSKEVSPDKPAESNKQNEPMAIDSVKEENKAPDHVHQGEKEPEQDTKEKVLESSAESASQPDHKAAKEAGFEVVSKAEVPQPESEEVKAAISAQGEDGQLLVNYVQVTKEDVPAAAPESNNVATAPAQAPANGIEPANALAKGDATANDATPEEPAKAECEQKDSAPPAEQPQAASETPVSQ